jgi:flagellin-specific chaperone FliS
MNKCEKYGDTGEKCYDCPDCVFDTKEINTEEILDLIHTSGLFSSNPIDDCPKCKCPIYFSCPNCIKNKMEEVYNKGFNLAIKRVQDIVTKLKCGLEDYDEALTDLNDILIERLNKLNSPQTINNQTIDKLGDLSAEEVSKVKTEDTIQRSQEDMNYELIEEKYFD